MIRSRIYRIIVHLYYNSTSLGNVRKKEKLCEISRELKLSPGDTYLVLQTLYEKDLAIVDLQKNAKYWKITEKGKELALALLKVRDLLYNGVGIYEDKE